MGPTKGSRGDFRRRIFDYFRNKETGFALEIKEVEKFKNPIDPKTLIPNFVPPQSFHYIKAPIEMKIVIERVSILRKS